MKLYHGSYTRITTIELSKCERFRDFGQGFYVTKFRHHAEQWAKKIGKKYDSAGFVTEYDFYESFFESDTYSIKRFNSYSDEWMDFIVLNRDQSSFERKHDFDIVEGPVADDKIQHRLDDFLKGYISRELFLAELQYHENTHQICFCTVKSLQTLINTDDLVIHHTERIGEQLLEALILDYNIDDTLAAKKFFSSDTFAKLSDKTTGLYLKSWQEIYELLKHELETK
jgi:hypothetical protein